MIKNERQYKITKAQIEKFAQAVEATTDVKEDDQAQSPLRKLERDAMNSEIANLRRELEEYDLLKSGTLPRITAESLVELPDALIKARIASGMNQKEFADKLGLKEQQVQRYEATGYSGASLARLSDVIYALGVQLRFSIADYGPDSTGDAALVRTSGSAN